MSVSVERHQREYEAHIRKLITRYFAWTDPDTSFDSEIQKQCQQFLSQSQLLDPMEIQKHSKQPRFMGFIFDESDSFWDAIPDSDPTQVPEHTVKASNTEKMRLSDDSISILELDLTDRISQMDAAEKLIQKMGFWWMLPVDRWTYGVHEMWLEEYIREKDSVDEFNGLLKDIKKWILVQRPEGIDGWWAPSVGYLAVAFWSEQITPSISGGAFREMSVRTASKTTRGKVSSSMHNSRPRSFPLRRTTARMTRDRAPNLMRKSQRKPDNLLPGLLP